MSNQSPYLIADETIVSLSPHVLENIATQIVAGEMTTARVESILKNTLIKPMDELPSFNQTSQKAQDVYESTVLQLRNLVASEIDSVKAEVKSLGIKHYDHVKKEGKRILKNAAQKINIPPPIVRNIGEVPSEILSSATLGTISSPFGPSRSRKEHSGIDLVAPLGTPVYSTGTGVVIKAVGNNPRTRCGNQVSIQHPDGYISHYCHLDTVLVKKGQRVPFGMQVGTSGNTGTESTGPHLHYGLQYPFDDGYDYVNPALSKHTVGHNYRHALKPEGDGTIA